MTRPALETLFSRAAQGRVFLLMAGCGLVLGGIAALGGWLHRRWRLLGTACDILCALLAAGMAAAAAFAAGDGLRLYALLGMILGAALYMAGIQPILLAMGRTVQKLFGRRQE